MIGGAINPNDFVRIKGQNSIGEVIKTSSQDAVVMFGHLKLKIKLTRLEKISKAAVKKIEKENNVYRSGIDINKRKANFSNDIDVRGKRASEAIAILNRCMDDAILFGEPNIRIIHGKGDGILRQVLREELKSYKEVKQYHDEHADRGGAGITVVELN